MIEKRLHSRSVRLSIRTIIATSVLIALAVLALPRIALADANTIAIYVEGPDAEAVRNTLLVALPVGITVAEEAAFRAALAEQGQKGPFGPTLVDARSKAVAIVRKAAASSGLDAVVVARMAKEKLQRTVTLLYVTAARPSADRDAEVVLGPKRSRDDAAKLGAFVRNVVEAPKADRQEEKAAPPEKAHAKPPPDQPAPPPTETRPAQATTEASAHTEQVDSASARPRGDIAHDLFDLEVGGEAAGRHFDYHDALSSNLRSYSVFPAALWTAHAEVFPFADFTGFIRDVGIMGAYSRSLFLSSATSNKLTLHTVESSYLVGVRVRLRPLGDDGVILGISDGYASQSVEFDSAQGLLDAQLPAVNCKANRTAVDGRVPFGKVSVLAEVGYRIVFDCGIVAQRFRRSSVGAIDAEVGGALSLARGWEARLVADYERYFYSFKPIPGDGYVAGGALDEFFGARLGLAYIF